MRRYHRWLAVLFGVFILWIAVTGVLSQIGSLVNNGGFAEATELRGKAQAAAIGVVISILSGWALVFLASSGLSRYIRTFSHRRTNNHKPEWFWK